MSASVPWLQLDWLNYAISLVFRGEKEEGEGESREQRKVYMVYHRGNPLLDVAVMPAVP